MSEEAIEKPESIPPGSLRLFIALALPDSILGELMQVSSQLRKGAQFTGCRLRWAPADSLHLTLAFLGNQPADRVGELDSILLDLAAKYPPQRLEIRSLGVFPHWKRPTVLWAGIRDRTRRLGDLHADLNRALPGFGCQPEDKPFRPHITLARFKESRNISAIEKMAHDQGGFKIGPFEADALTLYKSEIAPGGALHSPLSQRRLAAAPPLKEKADETSDAA